MLTLDKSAAELFAEMSRFDAGMSAGIIIPLPHEVSAYKEKLTKHLALVLENQPLAASILLPTHPACMAVISGHEHLEMGKQDFILENRKPITDIASLLSPDSRLTYGHIGEAIDVFVSIGSALSNLVSRIWDGHSETLERVRKPVFGSLLTEFDPVNKNVISYIEGRKVIEPFRVIVDERNRKQTPIFEPTLDSGILKEDALVLKVSVGCIPGCGNMICHSR